MSPRVGEFPQALESLSRNGPRHSTHGSGTKPAPTRGLITPIFSRISRKAKRSMEESHNTMNCPTPKRKPSPADAVSWKGMRDPTLNGALTRRFLREVAGGCLLWPVQPGQPPTLNTFGRGMRAWPMAEWPWRQNAFIKNDHRPCRATARPVGP